MKRLFIHVGLPKTGTSTLQLHFFPALSGVTYLGKPYGRGSHPPRQKRVAFVLSRYPTLYFQEKCTAFLRFICDKLAEPKTRQGTETFILSEEEITGSLLYPGSYDFDAEPGETDHYHIACANELFKKLAIFAAESWRCHEVKVKFLLTLRKQDELLHSFYATKESRLKQEAWGNSLEGYVTNVLNDGYYSHGGYVTDYHYLLNTAYYYLGEDDVCVLPYEMMQDEPTSFVQRLGAFMEVDVTGIADILAANRENVRAVSSSVKLGRREPRKALIYLQRMKRKVLGKTDLKLANSPLLNCFGYLAAPRIAMSNAIKQEVMERFKVSNKAVGDRTGMNLDKYGYY